MTKVMACQLFMCVAFLAISDWALFITWFVFTLSGDVVMRTFKSHWYSCDHMKSNGKSKFIYIARGGLDVIVSFYHHTFSLRLYNFTGSLSDFFEAFMDDDVDFSSWWEHILGWWKRRNDPDVLFLFYEDMKADPLAAVRQIGQFINVEELIGQSLDDDSLQKIVDATCFKAMKAAAESVKDVNEQNYRRGETEGGTSHFRTGGVGDGQVRMSEEQKQRFRERCEREFADSDFPWKRFL